MNQIAISTSTSCCEPPTPIAFSRCSSLNSLNSFDVKSVHSSVTSEYSISIRPSNSNNTNDDDLDDDLDKLMPDSPADPNNSFKTAQRIKHKQQQLYCRETAIMAMHYNHVSSDYDNDLKQNQQHDQVHIQIKPHQMAFFNNNPFESISYNKCFQMNENLNADCDKTDQVNSTPILLRNTTAPSNPYNHVSHTPPIKLMSMSNRQHSPAMANGSSNDATKHSDTYDQAPNKMSVSYAFLKNCQPQINTQVLASTRYQQQPPPKFLANRQINFNNNAHHQIASSVVPNVAKLPQSSISSVSSFSSTSSNLDGDVLRVYSTETRARMANDKKDKSPPSSSSASPSASQSVSPRESVCSHMSNASVPSLIREDISMRQNLFDTCLASSDKNQSTRELLGKLARNRNNLSLRLNDTSSTLHLSHNNTLMANSPFRLPISGNQSALSTNDDDERPKKFDTEDDTCNRSRQMLSSSMTSSPGLNEQSGQFRELFTRLNLNEQHQAAPPNNTPSLPNQVLLHPKIASLTKQYLPLVKKPDEFNASSDDHSCLTSNNYANLSRDFNIATTRSGYKPSNTPAEVASMSRTSLLDDESSFDDNHEIFESEQSKQRDSLSTPATSLVKAKENSCNSNHHNNNDSSDQDLLLLQDFIDEMMPQVMSCQDESDDNINQAESRESKNHPNESTSSPAINNRSHSALDDTKRQAETKYKFSTINLASKPPHSNFKRVSLSSVMPSSLTRSTHSIEHNASRHPSKTLKNETTIKSSQEKEDAKANLNLSTASSSSSSSSAKSIKRQSEQQSSLSNGPHRTSTTATANLKSSNLSIRKRLSADSYHLAHARSPQTATTKQQVNKLSVSKTNKYNSSAKQTTSTTLNQSKTSSSATALKSFSKLPSSTTSSHPTIAMTKTAQLRVAQLASNKAASVKSSSSVSTNLSSISRPISSSSTAFAKSTKSTVAKQRTVNLNDTHAIELPKSKVNSTSADTNARRKSLGSENPRPLASTRASLAKTSKVSINSNSSATSKPQHQPTKLGNGSTSTNLKKSSSIRLTTNTK